MKFLVWGTGQVAENFLSGIDDIIEEYIVAFVDNDSNKWGKVFYGKNILSPSQIKEYCFDKIVIWNTYEKEIRYQIIRELGLDEKVIIGIAEADNLIAELLEKKYGFSKKKVLVIGSKSNFMPRKELYEYVFDKVEFIDVQYLYEIRNHTFDYIILMNLMNISFLDRACGRECVENDIREKIRQYGINTLIFKDEIVVKISRSDHIESWGTQNIDKTFLVIRQGGNAGLGSFVLTVNNSICYAREKGYIPVVDMMLWPNQYLKPEEVGYRNAWEKFFEQPGGYNLTDILNSKNIRVTTGKTMPSREGEDTFYIVERAELSERINEFMDNVRWGEDKILGVLVRGTDYVNKRPYGHYVQPDIDMILQKVKAVSAERGYKRIYLCTEVEEVVDVFKNVFEDRVLCYPQMRYNKDYAEFLFEHKFERDNDEYLRGADYWSAIRVLSMCDALIAGKCGGTNMAVKINENKYEYTYIFDLGRYGIDDVEKK